MSIIPNVRDLLEGHIDLELESIDRLYLIWQMNSASPRLWIVR
jgi:hypothetical protein